MIVTMVIITTIPCSEPSTKCISVFVSFVRDFLVVHKLIELGVHSRAVRFSHREKHRFPARARSVYIRTVF